jgi:hypothetical protein
LIWAVIFPVSAPPSLLPSFLALIFFFAHHQCLFSVPPLLSFQAGVDLSSTNRKAASSHYAYQHKFSVHLSMHYHAQTPSTSSSVHNSSLMLQHEGNLYTRLGYGLQSNIYKTLLVQRHPLDVLLQGRFPIDKKPLSTEKAKKGIHIEDFVWAPKRNPSIQKRKAVALHCIRKQPKHCPIELIAVAAVDFLSGQVLINSRLIPNLGWNGSSRSESLHGWREIRATLFDYIDQDTVIIGHSVREDLEILRLLHKQIVDSQILATSAIYTPQTKEYHYEPYLENLCMDFLGIKIRQGATCPLENALASREVVLHCIRWPKDLDIWAKETLSGYWEERDERERRRFMKRPKTAGSSGTHPIIQKNLKNVSIKMNGNNRMLINYDLAPAYADQYQGGYQDAYEAGFASGFKVGYKRRYEQNIVPEDCVEMDRASPAAKRQKTHESTRDANGNESLSSNSASASQTNDANPSQVAKARSLLAHLMKDTKIKEVIQMLNQEQASKQHEAASCQAGSRHVAANC